MKKLLILLTIFISIYCSSLGDVIPKNTFNNLLNSKIIVFDNFDCYIDMEFWNTLNISEKKNFCKNVSDTYKYYKGQEIYEFYSLKDASVISKRSSTKGDYKILK